MFVAPIREIQAARFDVAAQSVVADMTDPGGGTATLLHPYTSRGKDGAEQLIVALQTGCEPVLFVAGHFRRTSAGLACSPIGVVLQGCSGRRLLQPWIEDAEEPVRVEAVDNAGPAGGDPLRAFHEDVIRALGALLLAGVANIRPRDVRMWEELATRTAELGFVRLTEPLRQLASEIETRHRTTGRSRESLFVAMKRVCIVACLLHELI